MVALGVLPTLASTSQGPGMPDWSFGRRGVAVAPIESGMFQTLRDVMLQPDGKILVVGLTGPNVSGARVNVMLARYHADGEMDLGFGSDGFAIYWLGDNTLAKSIALQADGKIIVAGNTDKNFFLLRLNPNGSLDEQFGTSGLLVTDFARFEESSEDSLAKIYVLADGRILSVGTSITQVDDSELDLRGNLVLVQHHPDGSLDQTYGQGGMLIVPLTVWSNSVFHLFRSGDGSVFMHASGSAPIKPWLPHTGSFFDQFIAKIRSDGQLDAGFGQGGFLRTPPEPFYPRQYRFQRDLANAQLLATAGGGIYHFNGDGSPVGLQQSIPEQMINGQRFWVSDLLFRPDGNFLAIGVMPDIPGGTSYGIARILANGTHDPTFASLGLVQGLKANSRVLVQPDGRFIVFTEIRNAMESRVYLSRYHGPQEAPATITASRAR